MANFINHTAFPALKFKTLDQNDCGFDIIVARVTYDVKIIKKQEKITLTQSKKQASLIYSDIHYNDPVRSSVEYESDLAPYKPKTDVIINATAFAPRGKASSCFDVAVKVGGKSKKLRIYGPRFWRLTPLGWVLEHPHAVDKLDVLYEYSSGGWYEVDNKTIASPSNHLGMGWYPDKYLKHCSEIRLPAPQIESTDTPIKSIDEIVTPEGFGFFGKSWRGRIEHAGTYDSAWVEKRHPYLPKDFDFRYWCGAHPALQIAHPQPYDDIPVELCGLIPADERFDQHVSFHIPVETLFVLVKTESGLGVTKDMLLDTIVIDMRARKVFCTYRIALTEELNTSEFQLRYIAAADRKSQRELAEKINGDASSSTFIPLPPGLIRKR